jgi:uncharacterized protein YegP (UPF0339 family)
MSMRASFVGPVLALAFLVGAVGDECPLCGPLPAAQAGKEKAGAGKLTFEITRDAAKEFRWRLKLKAANGQIIGAASEGYKAQRDADRAIDLIKKGAAKAAVEDMS